MFPHVFSSSLTLMFTDLCTRALADDNLVNGALQVLTSSSFAHLHNQLAAAVAASHVVLMFVVDLWQTFLSFKANNTRAGGGAGCCLDMTRTTNPCCVAIILLRVEKLGRRPK